VTREDFHREIGDAFDAISGSASPDLSGRVRSALVEAPEHNDRVWIAALAAAVIAVIMVGVLLVGNPLNRGPLIPGGTGQKTPGTTPSPVASASPSPSPNPSPSPSPTPQYACGTTTAFTGKTPPPSAFIDAVRTGTHAGYDRVTIEFKNGQPASIEVGPNKAGNKFMTDPKGDTVTLAGQVGLKIVIHTSDAHTDYNGSPDIKTGYTGLLEVRLLGDNEGYVTYGLGLSSPGCYTATILTNPTRLVIDIQVG
jgi:hypothetical protein